MANTKSAAKKARRDVKARIRNRGSRSSLKTQLKSFDALILSGNRTEALKLLPGIFGLVDRAQKTGLIHKNAANRKKSRLSIKVKKTKIVFHHPRIWANINGATIVASLSIIYLGVFDPSLPHVIFSLGTAPE